MLTKAVFSLALLALGVSAVPLQEQPQKRDGVPLLSCLLQQLNGTNCIAEQLPIDLNSIPFPALPFEPYDYIVVGAGTAGAALAARLAENPAIRVALIEAGTDYTLNPISYEIVSIPGFDTLGVGSADADVFNNFVDWGFKTTPQRGANNRVVRYARGKTLGGSSTRNFMIYQRGNKEFFDQSWVSLTGDKQWSWDNVLPDYKRSVHFTEPKAALRQESPAAQWDPNSFSKTGGPLQVSYPNTAEGFSKYAQLSMNEKGVKTAQDFNAGTLDGVQYNSATIDPNGGHRSNSRSSFLLNAGVKPNLNVFSGSLAKKIVFDNSTVPRATGVTVSYLTGTDLILTTLQARREVIVSAGAFQSPQLLMVSGIGPRDQLTAQGIPVLVENANVGQGMQDHVFMGPTYEVNSTLNTFTRAASDPVYTAAQFFNYTLSQLGPFTNNVADLIAFIKPSVNELVNIGAKALTGYPGPIVEWFSAPGYVGQFGSLFLDNARLGVTTGKQYATILAAIVAPQSRGTVTIVSPDTAVLPVIDPAWLTHPVDQKVAIYAFKKAREFFASNAMKEALISKDEFFPGFDKQTDEEILNAYRENLMTVWHASCTAAMGKDAKTSVLNSNMTVWGTQNLRVVDASSFPSLPPGHPQSTIYMLAERAAKLIRAANKHA